MKADLINRVKYSKTLYSVYYSVMNTVINGMKLFVKTDEKLILFNSFAGRKFDDSPFALFEGMKKDKRFAGYKLVWAFHDPDQFEVEGAEKIKTDTPDYFVACLKARVWITNSSFERGLHFKNKNTFYFNTWHGTPIKKMGGDINNNQSFGEKGKNSTDIMTAQSDFEIDVFSRMFSLPKSHFLKCGLPRNDILCSYDEQYRKEIREKLGVKDDQKIILYCPTFREYEKDNNNNVVMKPPVDLDKWEKELGDQYVLLFRAHYEVSKAMEIKENSFVKDMTDYQSLNELMIASDILISDYSSVFIDYSIMDKPMLHFTYDYDKYASIRGMYFDIREYINGAADEDGIIDLLKHLDSATEIEKTRQFRNQYVQYYGNAVRDSLNCIAEHLGIGE